MRKFQTGPAGLKKKIIHCHNVIFIDIAVFNVVHCFSNQKFKPVHNFREGFLRATFRNIYIAVQDCIKLNEENQDCTI